MNTEERAVFKQKIIDKIARTEAKIRDLEEMAKPIGPENAIGRVSRMDAINNKSVAEAALRNAKQQLSKLQVALNKVDQSSFGICAFCKQPIPPARLLFMPESSRCVRCADK
ncbi:MAG: TraR/DksA C4-type zinc finger protein [Bacteroidota bacterium]